MQPRTIQFVSIGLTKTNFFTKMYITESGFMHETDQTTIHNKTPQQNF